jgi:hypothetical protein
MKSLAMIDEMVTAAEAGWPLGVKALQTLRSQLVLDVAGIRRSVELVNEVQAPHLVLPEEPE